MKEKFVEIATRYKKTPEDVEKEYNAFAQKIKPKMEQQYPDLVKEKTDEYFLKNVSKIFRPDPYTVALAREKDPEDSTIGVIGTILAVTRNSTDINKNSFKQWQMREEYKKDPGNAVDKKMVREAVSQKTGEIYPVPMYSSLYKLGSDNKTPLLDTNGDPILDPNYGKDIPNFFIRKIMMLATEESCGEKNGRGWKIVYATIPYNKDVKEAHNPGVMRKSKLIGTINRQPYLTVLRDGYAEDLKDSTYITPSECDVWGIIKDLLPKEPNYIGLDQVEDQKVKKLWIARVNVMNIYSSDGKVSIEMNSDDVVIGVKASTRQPKLVDYVSKNVDTNREAYVICMRNSFKNQEGEWITYNELCGIIPSTEVDDMQDEIDELLKGSN